MFPSPHRLAPVSSVRQMGSRALSCSRLSTSKAPLAFSPFISRSASSQRPPRSPPLPPPPSPNPTRSSPHPQPPRSQPQPRLSSSPTISRNAIVAVVLFIASATLYYYETTYITKHYPFGLREDDEFSVIIRGKEYTFKRKPETEIESILTRNETTSLVEREGNPVKRWDSNHVPANEPCEDRSAVDIIPRGSEKGGKSWWAPKVSSLAERGQGEGKRDLVLVSVFDGHAGWATSDLLSKTLHPTIALALAGLQAGILPDQQSGALKNLSKYLGPSLWLAKTWIPEYITKTLQFAYVQMDENICQTPINLLPTLSIPANSNTRTQTDSSISTPSPALEESEKEAIQKFIALTEPAKAGSCAITTLVDAENEGLYVALAGDCRAVAGWQRDDGKWRCDVLTADQMGDNMEEVERMRKEHPKSEADTVIIRGRVQGALQPTRAFGDAIYKWTKEQGEKIAAIYQSQNISARPPRQHHYTPPYVTARPEVTYRRLKGDGEKLKFLIMATDGLWDRLSSEEAALLTAAYISHPKHEDVSSQNLPLQIEFVPPKEPRPYPSSNLPGSPGLKECMWTFQGDKNAATHLIRNSLGGADSKQRGELLSLFGNIARWKRDDVTVTVVFFE